MTRPDSAQHAVRRVLILETPALLDRQTDAAVAGVMEGHGSVSIGYSGSTVEYSFRPRVLVAIPSWYAARLQSTSCCVLFSFSDRPVHLALGIHREESM